MSIPFNKKARLYLKVILLTYVITWPSCAQFRHIFVYILSSIHSHYFKLKKEESFMFVWLDTLSEARHGGCTHRTWYRQSKSSYVVHVTCLSRGEQNKGAHFLSKKYDLFQRRNSNLRRGLQYKLATGTAASLCLFTVELCGGAWFVYKNEVVCGRVNLFYILPLCWTLAWWLVWKGLPHTNYDILYCTSCLPPTPSVLNYVIAYIVCTNKNI